MALAGQPTWYLIMQLRKFRNGQRDGHVKDEAGEWMVPVACALP